MGHAKLTQPVVLLCMGSFPRATAASADEMCG
jgi:hypothetical protein